ncbi:uncharacterized protein EMH_0023800 [Eimeria mitis]|uniref:Diphthine--ammonia ligase n=1 Tax=Eimeria mitis TaxID=44415 RepID=U6JW83_9EIME|nr:uncharacterized protein EMH_0023800 [Eimeria mitis]CDJ29674.1 hypothetical protein, conserved [Eimeria mitis]
MRKIAVALVSGGKDSVYAIECARRVGFSIRAVATLLPRDNAVETDSYMYQSVGTSLGAAIAECLGVPHYSAHVKGRPVNTETLECTFQDDDELYDLQTLLERVKKANPDVDAVTCGAILSEYQRRRLESICGYVRLLPVCLMWNREQKGLLKSMIDWGLHAVVVKTASMGLSKKHLGHSVSDLFPHFLELNRQYDFHVCGEGGEYETVTLDCPLFTRGSIIVPDWEQICHSDDAMAPVWLQSPLQWKIAPKDPANSWPRVQSDANVRDLELLRIQPYQDLIDTAVNDWGVDVHDGESAAAPSFDGEGPTPGIDPTSACAWDECGNRTCHARTFSSGSILTGDICVTCSKEGGGTEGDVSPPPSISWIQIVRESMRTWLDEQLSKTVNGGMRARIVEAVCQVCCPDFIGIPHDVFEASGSGPVALTVFVTPLPRWVQLRLRIVLGRPEGFAIPPVFSLKSPTDDSLLHVHSVNLWVPSCFALGTYGMDRLASCCSCQGVRCELVSESSLSAAYLFLRGCDGRLPFTCDFPDEKCGTHPFFRRRGLQEYRALVPALYTALQTANAFVSMQYTRHLCYTGGANRGFPHNDGEHFADGTELGGLDSTEPQDINSATLRVPQLKTPPFVASCFVVFVTLTEGKAETKPKSDKNLGVVERLVRSLIARSSSRSDHSFSGDDTGNQSVVIVAEAPNLPGKARVLILPMWDISPRLGDRACSQVCRASHQRQDGEKYTATVTVVERFLEVRKDTESTGRGSGTGIRSVVACLSFQRRHGYAGCQSLEELVEELCSTLTHWLKAHSVQEGVASLYLGNTEEAVTTRGRERVIEVCVFYCPSYLCSLQMDSESFEAKCLQRIGAGCCASAAASCEFSPIITFFPVLNLSGGLFQIVAHTLSAYA